MWVRNVCTQFVMERILQILKFVQDMVNVQDQINAHVIKIGIQKNVMLQHALEFDPIIHRFALDMVFVMEQISAVAEMVIQERIVLWMF